jgi:Fanconi anemia group M protein
MEIQNTLPLEGVTVFVDHREEASNVSRHLAELGSRVLVKQLKVGDYIASDRIGIERKQVKDFLASLMDQRLFKQIEGLSQSFESPLLIIEGSPELLYLERNIHPNAIRGALASITLDFKVPILYTQNPKESAAQIYWIAYREQVKKGRPLQIRASRKCVTENQLQEYVVSGLPKVNSKLSKRLLEKFGSVRKIFSAKPEKLMKVDGIGEKKAKELWKLMNREYEKC